MTVQTGRPILSSYPSLTMSSTRSRKQLLNFCFDTEIVALAVTVERTGSGQLFWLPSDFNCLACCEDPHRRHGARFTEVTGSLLSKVHEFSGNATCGVGVSLVFVV